MPSTDQAKMDNCMFLKQEAYAAECKRDDDEDAVDTTDQGSYGSDNEVASSVDSVSAYQCDVNLKMPATRKDGHELEWLVPSVCSRRAQLRGVGHGVLEMMSNDGAPGVELNTTGQGSTSHDKLVVVPSPPGLPPIAQKDKLVLLPTLLGQRTRAPSTSGLWQIASSSSQPQSTRLAGIRQMCSPTSPDKTCAHAGKSAQWKAAMVPRKVPCGPSSHGWYMHVADSDMPLKKRPLFINEALPDAWGLSSMPMKKGLSSFLLRDPPYVLAC
mmetsp:Transcript_123656/g.238544  ORF Transcript_123656/g.238544 Transcript_123656/m.238544 type:complete len:270 (+) Transcript_123656:111-920(+)